MEEKQQHTHPHWGHRGRLKTRFRGEGLSHFQEHEILELLLFYAIPQKDTNELAHQLIKRFGSLERVLSADYTQLLACTGISEHSATLLKLSAALSDWLSHATLPKVLNGLDHEAVGQFLVKWFRKKQAETLVAIFLDASGNMIGDVVELAQGHSNFVTIPTGRIVEKLTLLRASSFLLAHNHSDEFYYHSRADMDETAKIYHTFSVLLNKPLREHYIIAGEKVFRLVDHMQNHLMLQ